MVHPCTALPSPSLLRLPCPNSIATSTQPSLTWTPSSLEPSSHPHTASSLPCLRCPQWRPTHCLALLALPNTTGCAIFKMVKHTSRRSAAMAGPWVLIAVEGEAIAATREHHDVAMAVFVLARDDRRNSFPTILRRWGSACKAELMAATREHQGVAEMTGRGAWLEMGEHRNGERGEQRDSAWVHCI